MKTKHLADKLPPRVRYKLGVVRKRVASRFISKYRAISVGELNSLYDYNRLSGLQKVAEDVARREVRGDVVECGVFRGGSAVVIAERLVRRNPQRRVWLFDAFTGMPEPGPDDPAEAWEFVGKLTSNEEVVYETFRAAKLPRAQLKIVVGRYEETLVAFNPPPTSFLHIDCDWYQPVRLCLETFYDAVAPGGAVVFDDYGFWSGCRKAVDEFLLTRGLAVNLIAIDSSSHYFYKPDES